MWEWSERTKSSCIKMYFLQFKKPFEVIKVLVMWCDCALIPTHTTSLELFRGRWVFMSLPPPPPHSSSFSSTSPSIHAHP